MIPGRLAAAVCALFFLGAVAAASARGPAAPTVDITIHFSHFDTSSIPVTPGETVRFVIHNEDPIDHEFIVGDRRVQRVHENGTEPSHGAKPGEISVPAGSTVETTYTFPIQPEHIEFACHLPGHYVYGMHGLFVFG